MGMDNIPLRFIMWKFFDKLKQGLSKTHQGFVEKIDRLFLGKKVIDQDVLDELEGLLLPQILAFKRQVS
jgi:fused signal recognition particle receptor